VERKLYMAKKTLKGKKKIYKPGDFIALSPEKAQPFVEKGSLEEIPVVETIRREIASYGGVIFVKSAVLQENIAFCLKENKNKPPGIITYTEEELASLILKNPTPESLKIIHEVKKTLGGQIIR